MEKPSYPGVARGYGVSGTVTARFSIGDDGKVTNAVYEGKQSLTPSGNETLNEEIRYILERTKFVATCRGNYLLIYRFSLRSERSADPHTTVQFNPPNEFVIEANHDVLTCSVYSIEKPSVTKRFLSWIRRRGAPATIYATECR
jgi:TonB family protein